MFPIIYFYLTHNNLYKHSSLLLFSKKGETISTALASPQLYNRVLAAVEDATHTLTAQPLTSAASLKKAYDLYEHAKSACEALPHGHGRALAQERLMFLYKYITDSRRILISDDFNTKTEMIVNTIDKATRSIEENKPDAASRLYGKAQELFASLPDESTLLHKKENTRRNLTELHQRIVHAKEVEHDRRFYQLFHSTEMLLDRVAALAKTNPAAAKKTYVDVLKVYRSLNVPPSLFWKKAALRKRMHLVEALLKPAKKEFFVPQEHALSSELVAVIAGNHGLKSNAAFPELVKLLSRLESCSLAHLDAARDTFGTAKRIAMSLSGDKSVLNQCFAKMRSRLELLSLLERIQHTKTASDIHALLADVQRRSLDYNKYYPHDHAFTDKIYEECALLQTLLDEGVSAGEVARAMG